MDDRYAGLRASLDHLENLDHTGVISSWVSQASAVRSLLADYDEASARAFYETDVAEAAIEQVKKLEAERDRLRDALWVVTEHNALHFGESHNTVIVARAALAQEQGESDGNQA